MKKSLVALAALAATSAFAQFSIDGVFDAGYQSINYKGNTVSAIAGNGSSTSQINFRGNEDLGGGLRAVFRVETDWNTVSNKANQGSASSPVTLGNETVAAASAFGNGEIRGGLTGGFGEVHLGAVNYNSLSTFLAGQPFGTAIGSGFHTFYINDVQSTSQVRAENAIKYVSPAFNGVTAVLYKSNKQTKAADTTATATANAVKQTSFTTSPGGYDQQGTQEVGLNYAAGPIAASFSNLKVDNVAVGTGTTTSTVNTLGANYTMGALKLFLLNQTNKNSSNTTNNKATTVSATYTMGPTVLMAQTGSLSNASGVKSNFSGLGLDYNLSKMTALYLRAENTDDKAGAMNAAINPTTIAGTENKFARTALGVRIGF